MKTSIAIPPIDWAFESIRADNAARASRLETCPPPEILIDEVAGALAKAIDNSAVELAVDSKGNLFSENYRVTLQFPVAPELYDWFFNARSGYRAQYFIAPHTGEKFNAEALRSIAEVLKEKLPDTLDARRIHIDFPNGNRSEKDAGSTTLTRTEARLSLQSDLSKIWICERRYSARGMIEEIGFALFSGDRSAAKLDIPRWASAIHPATSERGEGLRAPCPDAAYAWLDVKGCFIGASGRIDQPKKPGIRAQQIHDCGWT